MVKDQVVEGSLAVLAARIESSQTEEWKLRTQMQMLKKGSDERLRVALEVTHAKTRVEALKEAWSILTGEAF